MSRYWDDGETIEQRIARGLIVEEFGPDGTDALDYIAVSKGWD